MKRDHPSIIGDVHYTVHRRPIAMSIVYFPVKAE